MTLTSTLNDSEFSSLLFFDEQPQLLSAFLGTLRLNSIFSLTPSAPPFDCHEFLRLR